MPKSGRIVLFAYSPEDFIEKRLDNLSDVKAYMDYPVVWVNVEGMEDFSELLNLRFSSTFLHILQRSHGPRALVLKDHHRSREKP
ncbi:MAG: magnesium transporter [Thermococcaceae archaeon]|nr:magnesium transporter [Thermococcaceae archaeon]MDK2914980.1 magnesium transporter [Thermococcaceae archaeon]